MAKVGHPLAIIDWELVDELLQADCEGSEIAAYIGIHANTLYERCKKEKKCNFSEYLQEKKAKGNSMLKVKQFESAVNDKNISMQIWLGKQRLGQSDHNDLNVNVSKEIVKELFPDITEIPDVESNK